MFTFCQAFTLTFDELNIKSTFAYSYSMWALKGWKREVVQRSTTQETLKTSADVYYFTPSNKKLRSLVQLEKYCKYSKC